MLPTFRYLCIYTCIYIPNLLSVYCSLEIFRCKNHLFCFVCSTHDWTIMYFFSVIVWDFQMRIKSYSHNRLNDEQEKTCFSFARGLRNNFVQWNWKCESWFLQDIRMCDSCFENSCESLIIYCSVISYCNELILHKERDRLGEKSLWWLL